MIKLRLGVDVDGILADFNIPYKALIEKNHPSIKLPDIGDSYPNTWNYERAAGLLSADVSELWRQIKTDDRFWLTIPPYTETDEAMGRLEDLENCGADIYFITSRVGDTAKYQTEQWLDFHGFFEPTVLISSEKGMCCRALNLTHYIDDKNENCTDVRDTAPGTAVTMLKRPWNTPQEGVPVVNSVIDWLESVDRDAQG